MEVRRRYWKQSNKIQALQIKYLRKVEGKIKFHKNTTKTITIVWTYMARRVINTQKKQVWKSRADGKKSEGDLENIKRHYKGNTQEKYI